MSVSSSIPTIKFSSMKMTILTNCSVVTPQAARAFPGTRLSSGGKGQKGVIVLCEGDFVSFLGIYIYMERLIRPRVRIA